MGHDIDYRTTDVPEDKSPAEYTYAERRAEILQLIEQAGHPRAINQTRLAERYGCTQGNISNDVSVLREYIVETIDERTVDSITETVFQKAIQELVSNGEHMEAVKAVEKWNNWLFDRGKVDKVAEQKDVSFDGQLSGGGFTVVMEDE